jgi:hypothetical protein
VIEPVPGRRAVTEPTSTSPLVTVAGRSTVKVVPNPVAVVTAFAGGIALKARPEPAMAKPRITARARKGS